MYGQLIPTIKRSNPFLPSPIHYHSFFIDCCILHTITLCHVFSCQNQRPFSPLRSRAMQVRFALLIFCPFNIHPALHRQSIPSIHCLHRPVPPVTPKTFITMPSPLSPGLLLCLLSPLDCPLRHHLLKNEQAMDCDDVRAASIQELDEQLEWEFSINGGSSFDKAISDDAKMNHPLADLCWPIVGTAKKAKKKPVIANSVPSVSTHPPPLFWFPSCRFPPNHTSTLPHPPPATRPLRQPFDVEEHQPIKCAI
jgi:hypothetical protein